MCPGQSGVGSVPGGGEQTHNGLDAFIARIVFALLTTQLCRIFEPFGWNNIVSAMLREEIAYDQADGHHQEVSRRNRKQQQHTHTHKIIVNYTFWFAGHYGENFSFKKIFFYYLYFFLEQHTQTQKTRFNKQQKKVIYLSCPWIEDYVCWDIIHTSADRPRSCNHFS